MTAQHEHVYSVMTLHCVAVEGCPAFVTPEQFLAEVRAEAPNYVSDPPEPGRLTLAEAHGHVGEVCRFGQAPDGSPTSCVIAAGRPDVTETLIAQVQHAVRQIDNALADTRMNPIGRMYLRKVRGTLLFTEDVGDLWPEGQWEAVGPEVPRWLPEPTATSSSQGVDDLADGAAESRP